MSELIAIDPGSTESAWVHFSGSNPVGFGKECNHALLLRIQENNRYVTHIAIEMIACYGMPVGAEVFDTCVWIGRFRQAFRNSSSYVYRKDEKMHLCGNMKAKDGNIRQALIDKYGGKEMAIGTKKKPGTLYGMSGDCWAALAVGVTYLETRK